MIKEISKNLKIDDLISNSRNSSFNGYELAKTHRKMGEILGREILGSQKLIYKDVLHAQGDTKKMPFYDDEDFAIIILMRAGLFIAEGIWKNFPSASFVFINSKEDIKSNEHLLKNKKLIIVDSVINTGLSLKNIIDEIKFPVKNIFIATAILQEDSVKRFNNYNLYAIRISKNKYKGIGSTDTGNRLFNS